MLPCKDKLQNINKEIPVKALLVLKAILDL